MKSNNHCFNPFEKNVSNKREGSNKRGKWKYFSLFGHFSLYVYFINWLVQIENRFSLGYSVEKKVIASYLICIFDVYGSWSYSKYGQVFLAWDYDGEKGPHSYTQVPHSVSPRKNIFPTILRTSECPRFFPVNQKPFEMSHTLCTMVEITNKVEHNSSCYLSQHKVYSRSIYLSIKRYVLGPF